MPCLVIYTAVWRLVYLDVHITVKKNAKTVGLPLAATFVNGVVLHHT